MSGQDSGNFPRPPLIRNPGSAYSKSLNFKSKKDEEVGEDPSRQMDELIGLYQHQTAVTLMLLYGLMGYAAATMVDAMIAEASLAFAI